MTTPAHRGRGLRRWLVGGGVVIVLAGLLLADLANRGLAWQAFYALTGEESPPAQIIGMMQWTGRWFRQQPDTAPYTPMDHTSVSPYGINVFLEQEVEIEKRERQLQMIADAGFVWLRQEFPWEDIEIHGKGDFEDRRNDRNGDGVLDEADAVSSWDKYDNIVDLTEQYGLRLQVRLSNPPSWTHADPAIGDKAPPDNLQDYIDYATAVAERYRGRISHYQIWNEPNIYPEWGNQDANPEAYTEMLCRTYDALKAIDPDIVVVSGAMAPTNAMGGVNLNDYIYLQRMFDDGAGECFDILSMQGYGLNSGPTDRRMRPTTVNFARVLYIRDLMVANGYAHKPIWISEAAWNPVPNEDEVPDIDARYNFGQVTEEQAARYMVEAYQRADREWPFVGVTFYWFFKRAADFERNQSFYYFRMVEPDFTPMPVYAAVRDYITQQTPTLYKGVHQEDDPALVLAEGSTFESVPGAEFDTAARTSAVDFVANGTELAVRWQAAGAVNVYRDGELVSTLTAPNPDAWQELRLRLSWRASAHDVRIEAVEGTMLLDSVTVFDNTVRDIALVVGAGLLVMVALFGGWAALAQRGRQAA